MIPPSHLMVRVSGNDEASTYAEVGTRLADKLLWTAAAHTEVWDVLDWGCGPGRLAAHIAAAHSEITLRGCDIDAEAIGWANKNIGPYFDVTGLYPPLPYEAASFDAVFALSVMTHLDRQTQRKWLKELARVIRPGGVFIASVHGREFAKSCGVTQFEGIDDHYLNIGMAGIVPDGYYRDVIQTEEYTRWAWTTGIKFEMAAYEETALELHDMVVLRRQE